jgi:hypothetical protein
MNIFIHTVTLGISHININERVKKVDIIKKLVVKTYRKYLLIFLSFLYKQISLNKSTEVKPHIYLPKMKK